MMNESPPPIPTPSAAHRAGQHSDLLDRAFTEFCRRRQAGEAPDPDDFCDEYPGLQSSLRLLLVAERFLEEHPSALGVSENVDWPEVGDEFLGLKLERELGRGSFGRVFLATEPALGNRRVAVKVALRGGDEASTLGRLKHPNIVPVHSLREDRHSGLTAVVMPYEGAVTLCDVLEQVVRAGKAPDKADLLADLMPEAPATANRLRRLSYVQVIAELGAQMAEGLAHAHSQDVHHLDLKPSNVLLAPDGRPMLLDFNLAFDSQARHQKHGGTLAYMAPEQLAATSRDTADADRPKVDGKADLFALGVVLYELLSGRHPFGPVRVKTPEPEIRAQLNERHRASPIPLNRVAPNVPPALSRLIHACLSVQPSQRPASASEIAQKLRQISSPRRRTVLWAAVTALLLCGTGVTWAATRPSAEATRPSAEAVGLAALEKGEWAAAIIDLKEAAKENPNSAKIHFALGRAYQHLKQHRGALPWLTRAAELDADARTLAALAYSLSLAGDPKEALKQYQKAHEAGFESAALWHDAGQTALELGELPHARQCLSKALTIDPKLQLALYARARVDLREAEADQRRRMYVPVQGVADVQAAIALGPRWTLLHRDAAYLMAMCELHRKEREKRLGANGKGGQEVDPVFGEAIKEQIKLAFDMGQDWTGLRNSPIVGPWVRELPDEIGKNKPEARPVPPPEMFLDPLGDK